MINRKYFYKEWLGSPGAGLVLAILFLSLNCFAQKNLLKGVAYFDRNMFKEAIPYFEAEMEKGEDSKIREDATEKLADCYRLLGEFTQAETLYKKLVQRSSKNSSHILNYGLSLKASSKYQEAAEIFKKYIKLNPSDLMGPVYLESCSQAQKWLDENMGNQIKNLDFLNTEYSEFSPVFYKDGFVFCSSRPGSKKKLISFSGEVSNAALDFYFVNLHRPSDSLTIEVFEKGRLNTYLHEGPAAFSITGDTIYFTRTNKGGRDPQTNIVLKVLNIMMSYKTAEGWSEPISAFSFNGTNYSIGHPSLSCDGKTMYFMSDMPGGKGATDIYKTQKQADSTWGPPVNLGSKVNTFGYELFPFNYDDTTLYFSSDAFPGMGKLDVFMAKNKHNTWGNVTNLKPPINSIGDDFAFVMDREYRQGFISSDRFDSKGLEDIYAFSEYDPIKIEVDGSTFKIPDNSLFDGFKYKLVENETKKETPLNPIMGKYCFSPEQGKKYTLSIRKDGFSYDKIEFDFVRNTDKLFIGLNIFPKTKDISLAGYLKQDKTDSSGIVTQTPIAMANVELQVNERKSTHSITNKEGYFECEKLVSGGVNNKIMALKSSQKAMPSYTIMGEINSEGESVEGVTVQLMKEGTLLEEGLTNLLGTFSFQTKIHSTENYIIEIKKDGFIKQEKAILPTDFTNSTTLYKEYEIKPEAKEEMKKEIKEKVQAKVKEEAKDSAEKDKIFSGPKAVLTPTKEITPPLVLKGTIMNVKKEPIPNTETTLTRDHIVVDETRTDTGGNYTFYLKNEGNYTVSATNKGYFPYNVNINTNEIKDTAIHINHIMEEISLNKTIRLDNIYYDYDKATIRYESIPTLDKLVSFMTENPEVIIELSAHTDDRGSNEYNLKLSQERALNAARYLILEDIDSKRIVHKGYGETKPVKKTAQTEEEYQLNRRTEFKVLSR